jgi:ankyrin repeat protein
MNPDRRQQSASGSSSSSSQAQGHSADVELLVAKFSTNTPATTPETFTNKQKQQQAEAHRSYNNARDNVTGIRLSLRSAMAAVKPKTIAKMATNAVLVWRKTSDQPSSLVSSPARLSVESGNPTFGALVQEDDADQGSRNALWKIAEAILNDDASDLFMHMERCESAMRCEPHPEPESPDSSNEAVQQVGKIFEMLQENIETNDIRSAVLVVSVRFSRAAIVRAILADNRANGVEWNSQQQCALEHACTNGHLEIATLLACADGTQVSSMVNQSLALRYYCLAGDLERAQEILAEDSQDVDIGAALLDACRNGHCDIVALLIADARFDSSTDGDEGFRVACGNHHAEVVSLQLSIPVDYLMMDGLELAATAAHCDVVAVLVQDPRVNPGLDKSFALEKYCHAGDTTRVTELLDDPELDGGLPGAILAAASGNGRTAIVQPLLTDSRVDPSVDEIVAIRLASARGHDSVVELLLADPRVDPAAKNNHAIQFASSNGHEGVVKLLLADPRVDPAADGNYAIRNASSNGRVSAAKLLLADPRVDPAADGNYAIRYASSNGHEGVVKLLLAAPRVDPAADGNYAIFFASYHGRASVVKLLLADPRVDPAVDSNWAIRDASGNGHVSVVKLLLADPRVDPAADSNWAIRNASSKGHASVVELLLADLRVDPAVDGNYAINLASYYGRASVVKFLLADPRVDPAADSNWAIRYASSNGHEDVVKLLLADPRVDPAADGNYAIRNASSNGRVSVVKLLLADPRVDPGAQNSDAIRYASYHGRASVVELLLEHPQVVVTKAALMAADEGDHEDIVRLMFEKQPQVILDLFESATPCKSGGSLQSEVHQREKASAQTLLLAVERIGVAVRVSDVLREVITEYACFDLVENEADKSDSTPSDDSYDSSDDGSGD